MKNDGGQNIDTRYHCLQSSPAHPHATHVYRRWRAEGVPASRRANKVAYRKKIPLPSFTNLEKKRNKKHEWLAKNAVFGIFRVLNKIKKRIEMYYEVKTKGMKDKTFGMNNDSEEK